MFTRVSRINEVVKKYDRRLYAIQIPQGMIQIHRQADRMEASDFNQEIPETAHLFPQFIFALTDTWKLQGQPVDWGIEPIRQKLRQLDSWRDDSHYARIVENRDRIARDKDRMHKNELRATALDMRRDFAKATNDINTSSLAKIDARRNDNGNSK